ncbi:serine hydrolase [Pontibacter sp. G13]|uniref:serine hydrolase domain-containing protein n=1 Tax=Pontibacter sp. G13 TaxID=3074898 RepID=UPI0028894DD4|nr:serine hydrolase [Pontibacter sp. G13]WNJ19929.1 serine hydrolase [Pontibacter sp. G13]
MKFLRAITSYLFLWVAFGSLHAQQSAYYPPAHGDWATKTPQEMGFDAALLDSAVAFAESHEYTGSRDLRQAILKSFEYEPFHKILGPTKKRGGPAGLVLKDGFVVAEWGDLDRVDMTFSITKSYLSTVAGLAAQDSLIGVHDPVGEYVWDGTYDGRHNAQITWAHLLNQSSDWSGTLWGGHDWADRPPREGNLDDWERRELHTPGTHFKYNDVRVNLLAYSLLQVWRKPLPQVLKEHIMDPIGASSTWRWFGYDNSWVNVDGVKMQSVSGGGHSGGGMFINTWDHARFGLLFLRNGQWNGKQLISPEWISQATQPSPANDRYGFMWWLNTDTDRAWEGVSHEVYYAAGFGGNFIVIDPTQEVVIVTRWLEPSQIGTLTQQILGALKDGK